MISDWTWVDSSDKLAQARKDLAGASKVGVDTEYDSFRYFREKLCLLQVRADQTTYLFDPLGDLDLSFLGDVFADPGIIKILHAGDNDVRILKRDYAFEFSCLFDTSRGCGDPRLPLSFPGGPLSASIWGVDFEKQKKMQRSQWGKQALNGWAVDLCRSGHFFPGAAIQSALSGASGKRPPGGGGKGLCRCCESCVAGKDF